jgi:hypothetical protein
MQYPTKQPTVFVNVHAGAFGPEAFETVHTSRHEAAVAAEDYADSYLFTLTDAGKIDLTPEFSEGYHERRDFDASVDARIDQMKELESFTMHERA